MRASATVIRDGCRAFAADQMLDGDYTAWIVQSFSSVLCVDEVYQVSVVTLLDGDSITLFDGIAASV